MNRIYFPLIASIFIACGAQNIDGTEDSSTSEIENKEEFNKYESAIIPMTIKSQYICSLDSL